MKIIILGSDAVSTTLAENLAIEENDVTLVDENTEKLRELRDFLDIRTIEGLGARPNVLRQANAEDADMIIAITGSDEVNMVACQVAHTLFDVPTKIARVRSQEYLVYKELFDNKAMPVDVLISPEQLVTDYVVRLIEHPGSLQVMDFAGGRVKLVAVRASYNGPLVGHTLKTLHEHIPNIDIWVAAIFRRGQPILPTGDTIIEVDDEVFFVAASHAISEVVSELGRKEKNYKRIMIAGGGNIGMRLAQTLERKMRIKVIEHGLSRVQQIGNELSHTLVLHGDVSDKSLLVEENIEDTDVFCAVTNDDEANIMSAMLAKRLGCRKVMALINRSAYVDLVQGGSIDIAISPQQATISGVLSHIRRGDVVKDYSLRHGAAEAIEAIAHGDSRTSKVIGRRIDEIKLPPGTTIGAVVKGDKVIIGHSSAVIEPEDHVVLFLTDKAFIHEVESLFQVSFGYF